MLRATTVRGRVTVPIACSLFVAIVPFSAATAEYGIPAGSGAVITAGQPLMVRATPGWDAEVSYEIADGSYVTVWNVEQAAPDGSMWYPVDGGFVPADAVTSVATREGSTSTAPQDSVALYQDAVPDASTGAWVDPPTTATASTDPWVKEDPGKPAGGFDPATGEWVDPATGQWVEPAPVVAAPIPPAPVVEPALVDTNVSDETEPWGQPIATASIAGTGGGGSGGDLIASFAMQYQGYPYVYAGEGPYAFDCSGFTKFVIQNTLGIDIPHDMVVQYAMGQQVSRDALQPGDLVFFANTFRPGISHNGVYIGGGQFVHAENESRGVKVSALDSEYYSARWHGAVRFS